MNRVHAEVGRNTKNATEKGYSNEHLPPMPLLRVSQPPSGTKDPGEVMP